MNILSKKYHRINPWIKGFIWFSGALIILIVLLALLVNFFGDDYIARNLKEKVIKSSSGTYTIDLDNLNLNIFTGSVTINGLQINANTNAFKKSHSSPKNPSQTLYEGTVGELHLSGLHLLRAIFGEKLEIGKLLIKKPNIIVINNPNKNTKKLKNKHHFSSVDSTIYADISGTYHTLKLGSLVIQNAHLAFMQTGDTLSSIGRLNATLKHIKINRASVQSGRKFITRNISLEAHHFTKILSGRLNKITFKKLSISSRKHLIILDSLRLVPLYPKFKYSQKNGTQTDRINFTIPAVIMRGVDFVTFVKTGRFNSRMVEINNAKLEDFYNKMAPAGTPDKKTLPNTAFINMRQKIKLNALKINHSSVSYAEYHKHAPKAGKITFKNLNATFKNVTNYRQAVKKGENVTIDAQARVMGKGLLTTHFAFPLDTKNGFHKIRGSLSSMPFTDFNPVLEYVAFARADKGKLNHLDFQMSLNNNHSSGTVIMNYEHLKVSILNKKSMKRKGVLKNLVSFAANKFIIKKNNTPKKGMRTGKIAFKRDQTKGIFNYWWKSLLSGIKNSIK